jgi:hypothetical protein
MEKVKLILKNHWRLLFLESVIVAIYVIISLCVDSNQIQEFTILSILFSAEFFVAMIVAIAAIYSWLQSKSKSEYEKNLQMLKDIDNIREFYRDKNDELEIIGKCQEHIDYMRTDFKNNSDTFLEIYMDYVTSKFQNNDSDSDNELISKYSEQDSGEEKVFLLKDIKKLIADTKKIPVKYVRYSKNYKENGFLWSTWYSLDEKMIKDLRDNECLIFFTKVDDVFKGVQFEAPQLKLLASNMKPSNSKTGNKTFDFYIRQKDDGTFYESRNGIELSAYNVKKVNFDFLKQQ